MQIAVFCPKFIFLNNNVARDLILGAMIHKIIYQKKTDNSTEQLKVKLLASRNHCPQKWLQFSICQIKVLQNVDIF